MWDFQYCLGWRQSFNKNLFILKTSFDYLHPRLQPHNKWSFFLKDHFFLSQDCAADGSLRVFCSCFMFLLVCPVFSYIPAISFTRDELLDIRKYTPSDISLVFIYSDILLDIVVGGAAGLFRRLRMRRRGKRAGVLVKLWQRGFRTALPSIHLTNLRSLPNKMDKLLLLSWLIKDFSAAPCFTENLVNDAIPDSTLHLPNFQRLRADRNAESTGNLRGGGISFYINERWCTDVTVLKKMCWSDVETVFIKLQAVLLAEGVLFAHSHECLHSSVYKHQFLWGYVHSYQDSFNLQQWQIMVPCKTQTAPTGQRRCLQEGG